MSLKPQDVVVALKLLNFDGQRPPFAQIAQELSMSGSEVHAAMKRAQAAHLVHGPAFGEQPNRAALEEFLIHGLKYTFPAQYGAITRGLPTSYAAEPLRRYIAMGNDPPPVWPDPDGPLRGTALEPLYPSVPHAAKRDAKLYELLALVDAIRGGRARERNIATKELLIRLRSKQKGLPKRAKSEH
jgi:DNA-binding Lrp family transcriptional regulator